MSMRRKTKRKWTMLWLCYGAVMLAWLLWCGGRLALDSWRAANGQMQRQELAPSDFSEKTSGIAFSGDWANDRYFTTTDADPQLHLAFNDGANVGRVVFSARAVNKPGGEMALYYNTKPGQDFSEARKLPAMQNANGGWVFDLQGRKVYALRLDPDSVGGVYWQVYHMVLNETKPPLAYFTPDALECFVLLFAPALLYAALAQLVAFFQPALSRRRLERRWQQEDGRPAAPPRGKAAPPPVQPKEKPAGQAPPKPVLPPPPEAAPEKPEEAEKPAPEEPADQST